MCLRVMLFYHVIIVILLCLYGGVCVIFVLFLCWIVYNVMIVLLL